MGKTDRYDKKNEYREKKKDKRKKKDKWEIINPVKNKRGNDGKKDSF